MAFKTHDPCVYLTVFKLLPLNKKIKQNFLMHLFFFIRIGSCPSQSDKDLKRKLGC